MTRRVRLLPLSLAAAVALLVPSCMPRDHLAPTTTYREAPPAAGHGLDPIYGQWETDKSVGLRAQPTGGSPVIASLPAGQPVTALGRMRGTDWVAVRAAGTTAYVRLYLLRLRGTEPRTTTGSTTTLARPTDNAGPAIKAAPRQKIQATPIGG